MKAIVLLEFPDRGDLRFGKVFDFPIQPFVGLVLHVEPCGAVVVNEVQCLLDISLIEVYCDMEDHKIWAIEERKNYPYDMLAENLQNDQSWKQFGDYFVDDNFPDGPSNEEALKMIGAS